MMSPAPRPKSGRELNQLNQLNQLNDGHSDIRTFGHSDIRTFGWYYVMTKYIYDRSVCTYTQYLRYNSFSTDRRKAGKGIFCVHTKRRVMTRETTDGKESETTFLPQSA